ncbi:hypothetical protein C1H46_035774 [Malus baccata]|uniref:Uncharacterized protein n=1 Tax=Malus baccata TaxID=106549 RepID=A0A540KX59_MALBA|nr:hypothetical protein C1H46_035774 [Malus baccata]
MSPSTSSPPPAYSIVLRHRRIKRLHEFQVRGGNAEAVDLGGLLLQINVGVVVPTGENDEWRGEEMVVL